MIRLAVDNVNERDMLIQRLEAALDLVMREKESK